METQTIDTSSWALARQLYESGDIKNVEVGIDQSYYYEGYGQGQ